MVWVPPPNGKRGRTQSFSDAAIQAGLSLKVLFGMPLRQSEPVKAPLVRAHWRTGVVQSLLRLPGLDWSAPDFSTLSRGQKTLNVNLPSRGSKGPRNLLVDSAGIKAEGEGEWNARKHGGPKRQLWRKIHIGIDKETLEVRAVEVTTSSTCHRTRRITPSGERGSLSFSRFVQQSRSDLLVELEGCINDTDPAKAGLRNSRHQC